MLDVGRRGRMADVSRLAASLFLWDGRADEHLPLRVENRIPRHTEILVSLVALADGFRVLVPADVELEEDILLLEHVLPRGEETRQHPARAAPRRGGDEEDA